MSESFPAIERRAARRNFERAARSYAGASRLEAEVGARMLERLDYVKIAPRLVLDAGSGPAREAKALAGRYRGARILALDFSLAMLPRARLLDRLLHRGLLALCADAGRILFAGEDLAGREGHRIARLGVARTYQIPRPFARLTVLDNVALAGMFGATALDRADAKREARRCLQFVGLADRARALPTELNLHQRKFLELARALASRPRLVLLDEVLAGLSPAEMSEAIELMREIRRRGATILFIEHIMRAVVDLTDRVVVLNHGQVIAEGRPREVIRQPDVVAAYLGTAHA